MGNEYRFRDIHGGAGPVNIGDGNISVGGDYQDNRTRQRIDNRNGVYAGRDLTVSAPSLSADLDLLVRALEQLRLTESERDLVARELDAARTAVSEPQSDPATVGGHVRRVTELLSNAGALATAGATLIDPLTRIGRWLGPVGAAVLALL
jgi:hypothetical protein